MKLRYLIVLVFVGFSFLFAQQEDAQKAWMEFMTPGSMHKILENSVGEWDTETLTWMYPGSEAVKSNASSKFSMILGGRYLQGFYSGSMMGMPFEGVSLEGFDNGLQQFVTVWIDNMGTGMAFAKGIYNEKEKTINYTGMMTDPLSKREVPFRTSVKIESKDKSVFTFFSPDGQGGEYKSMEMIYTRKK